MRLEIWKPRGTGMRQVWFSDEEPEALFRYRLEVALGGDGPPLGFLLHNPSTASHLVDDRTWLRTVEFARRENASAAIVINPAARRTPKPAHLRRFFAAGEDIIGPENKTVAMRAILDVADRGGRLVVGFGNVEGAQPFRDAFGDSARVLISEAERLTVPLVCLGRNVDGSPKHPLYVSAAAELRPWSWRR